MKQERASLSLFEQTKRSGGPVRVRTDACVKYTYAGTLLQAAEVLGVPMTNKRCADNYPAGAILADLVVPEQGIQLHPTSQINSPLAKSLAGRMPFAIAFHVRNWYSPSSARPASLKRVPFASSSFGISFS